MRFMVKNISEIVNNQLKLNVLLNDRSVPKSIVSDDKLLYIYNTLTKNDFLTLTSLRHLNNLNGWPRVVDRKSPHSVFTADSI